MGVIEHSLLLFFVEGVGVVAVLFLKEGCTEGVVVCAKGFVLEKG